jgi:acetolactate synthase-1/2/3 large subunit
MKKTGAYLAVYALEQIGVKYTYGIPGVHNTELYDELNSSEKITPILVTHEGGGAFMADGFSRTSKDSIGTMVIVPAAGLTHAMSGIGEARLDGIPILVISGGTRRDSGKAYQLHQIDQGKILDGIIKKYYCVTKHDEIISIIYDAYETAISGEPGPVFVEIPAELQLFTGEVSELTPYKKKEKKFTFDQNKIKRAVDLLTQAKNPGIFAGWGAVHASDELLQLAEKIIAPCSTTMQGLSAFPANHPLHTGVGFGPASVPASQKAFEDCDCLLAIGTRFAELATGSYGVKTPENLIHIDINPEVFDKNYKTAIAIEGDSKQALHAILKELENRNWTSHGNISDIGNTIQKNKKEYFSTWLKEKKKDLVSPGYFFKSLRAKVENDTILVVDDGQHTFLSAELFPVYQSRHFISPTDFNCMGYCTPAAIGAKLANPDKMVAAIIGDGAFLMTGMEILTAVTHNLGIIFFIFHDGELGQISQFQATPLNRKTCTILGNYNVEGFALATGAEFVSMKNDNEIDDVISKAIGFAKSNKPVIIDVKIDYSQKTFLTKGVIKVNLQRFPFKEKVRFIARAIKRHVLG